MIHVQIPYWNIRRPINPLSNATVWKDGFWDWLLEYLPKARLFGPDANRQYYRFGVDTQEEAVLLKLQWG